MRRHLSNFELDVYFAGDTAGAEVAEHAASCNRCAAYLDELRALDADPHVQIPAPTVTRGSVRPLRRILGAATGALALAAAVTLSLKVREPADDSYVGVKGAPAVQVLVRGDDGTHVWDGRSPVHPGDAIALHVACEQLTQFAVVPDTAELERFAEGACSPAPTTLPFTLVVDDQPGHERFVLVLSRTHLDDATLKKVARTRTRDENVWVTAFDFPKESR